MKHNVINDQVFSFAFCCFSYQNVSISFTWWAILKTDKILCVLLFLLKVGLYWSSSSSSSSIACPGWSVAISACPLPLSNVVFHLLNFHYRVQVILLAKPVRPFVLDFVDKCVKNHCHHTRNLVNKSSSSPFSW